MFTGIFIMAILLAGFVVLLRQAGSAQHPLMQILREKGIRPGRTEQLLCRRPLFVSAGQLLTALRPKGRGFPLHGAEPKPR